MANPNLALLLGMVRAMGPLCEQVVFVGGCATGLLLDDAALMDVRPTEDVDAIAEVASLAGYHRLAEQLMQRGFKQTMEDNTPPFRWYWNRMQLDLVPLDEKVLGFANPWYRVGYQEALSVELEGGLTVMEGRSAVAQEMAAAHETVRKHVSQSVAGLLDMPAFHNALPGLLSDPGREQAVKTRLIQISRLKDL